MDSQHNTRIVGVSADLVSHTRHASQDVYICRAKVQGSKGEFIETVEEADTLQAARDKALRTAERDFHHRYSAGGASDVPTTDVSLIDRPGTRNVHAPGKLNGGGNKPVTANQQNLIRKIADERGLVPTALCREMFSKDVSDITGAEANDLIRRMKASPANGNRAPW